jgi:hypothetical protein
MERSLEKAINLGPEWDEQLLARLRIAVVELGGTMTEQSWLVGGSQEVCSYNIELAGEQIIATAETYVGLSIRGPAHLVEKLDFATSKA